MKKLIRNCISIFIVGIITVSSFNSAFAGSYSPNIDVKVYTKDASYIENIKGKTEFNNKSDINIENENVGSITTKKININKQEIKGNGEIIISNDKKTSYENVKTNAIIDLDIEINTPIVHSETSDVTIKSKSETDFKNVDADKIYKFDYYYNNVIRLPY